MPQFDHTTFASQLFWLVVCFGVLCVTMRFFLLPRLTLALATRNQRIQENWEKANDLVQKLENLQKKNQHYLAEAHQKAHALMQEAIHDAHRTRVDQIASLDREVRMKIRKRREEIEEQIEFVRADLAPLLLQVTSVAAARLFDNSFSKSEIKGIIENILFPV